LGHANHTQQLQKILTGTHPIVKPTGLYEALFYLPAWEVSRAFNPHTGWGVAVLGTQIDATTDSGAQLEFSGYLISPRGETKLVWRENIRAEQVKTGNKKFNIPQAEDLLKEYSKSLETTNIIEI
jgi:hypothetical protein